MAATEKRAFQYLFPDGNVDEPRHRATSSDWLVESYVEELDQAFARAGETLVVRVRYDLEPSSLEGRYEDSTLSDNRKELLRELVYSSPVERVARKRL